MYSPINEVGDLELFIYLFESGENFIPKEKKIDCTSNAR